MGWFDEQIKERIQNDDREFTEAFLQISDAVTGQNMAKAFQSNRERTLGAIGEILNFYDCTASNMKTEFDNINDELEYLCRPNGIMRRSVKLEGRWDKDAFGAFLAFDSRTDEITALLPDRKSGKYRYFDNTTGKYVKITKKNASAFFGNAICFYRPLPLRKLKASDLFRYGLSVWNLRDIALPVILLVLVTAMGLLIPRLNHFLFDEVFEFQNHNLLISTILFLLCITISRILLDAIHTLITSKNQTKTTVSTEAAVMMRVLSLPADFFKEYSSGEITQRIAYANSICSVFIELFFDTGILSILSLTYFSQMARYAPALLVPAILMIVATIIASIIQTALQIPDEKARLKAQATESGVTYSLINGVQKIKLAGAEKRAFSRWGKRYASLSKLTYRPSIYLRLSGTIITAISLIGIVFIYLVAVKSGISVADYYSFESAYAIIFGAFTSLIGIASSLANIKPTLDMIKPILDAEPEISSGKQLVTHLSGNIELNNVSFRYSDDMPMVLDNLSLKIKAGQYVAIVGKTGCGKSTLMRLLIGFEKPQRGAVYYDGKDLSNLDLKSLRRCIGTVMQNGKLFQGDIYSNITISAPWLTLDEAWEAARSAGMADEIEQMPMGMQTLISEGTGGISGGQRQRLMIARAIAPKPNILFFDEATSALDNITQKIVSDSLDSLHCTRIVIAHRLSTIRHCDRIIFLDQGKIAEDGTYEELIAKNGLFAELVNRQRLDNEE